MDTSPEDLEEVCQRVHPTTTAHTDGHPGQRTDQRVANQRSIQLAGRYVEMMWAFAPTSFPGLATHQPTVRGREGDLRRTGCKKHRCPLDDEARRRSEVQRTVQPDIEAAQLLGRSLRKLSGPRNPNRPFPRSLGSQGIDCEESEALLSSSRSQCIEPRATHHLYKQGMVETEQMDDRPHSPADTQKVLRPPNCPMS